MGHGSMMLMLQRMSTVKTQTKIGKRTGSTTMKTNRSVAGAMKTTQHGLVLP